MGDLPSSAQTKLRPIARDDQSVQMLVQMFAWLLQVQQNAINTQNGDVPLNAQQKTGLLHLLQLFLHCATVTTTGSITPAHDGSIVKNASKSSIRRLDLLHGLKLTLHGATITSVVNITLCHDGPIDKDGCESASSGRDLLHVLQTMLCSIAAKIVGTTTPGHDGTIAKDGSESLIAGLNLLDILQPVLHGTTITAMVKITQVTTAPSPRIAAKAVRVAWICCTFFS